MIRHRITIKHIGRITSFARSMIANEKVEKNTSGPYRDTIRQYSLDGFRCIRILHNNGVGDDRTD